MVDLSIIVPVYNEENSIKKVLSKLSSMNFKGKKEIIIIDDGSTDGTKKILSDYSKKQKFRFISRTKNKGKGKAIRLGLRLAKGKIIAFQDGDLEYDIRDLENLTKRINEDKLQVLYGSRFLKYKGKNNFFIFGNKILSKITSLLYNSKITDMETGYKLFQKEVLKGIKLKSNRFGIEPELTAKILKKGHKIYEIPIKYAPRKIEEGKKIKYRDGITALFILFWYKFFD